MFEKAKAKDDTGRSKARGIRYIEWLLGTVVTAGRRKSFICDTGGLLCFYCTLLRDHIKLRGKHGLLLKVMRKTGNVYMHIHIKTARLHKISDREYTVTLNRLKIKGEWREW